MAVEERFLKVGGHRLCRLTNVAQGKGDKEQQFRLWFDATAAFHTYSIVWNPQRIIFLVDNNSIREYSTTTKQSELHSPEASLRVYCSLWNADDWATQGGRRVKTDWTKAPFVAATYRNFHIEPLKPGDSLNGNQAWRTQELDSKGRNRMRWVQQKYMIHNYGSTDSNRFPQGIPAECKRSAS